MHYEGLSLSLMKGGGSFCGQGGASGAKIG